MVTFTWTNTNGGDWLASSNWSPTTGAPPGHSSNGIDAATFNQNSASGGSNSYVVTVGAGESFDVNTINISNTGNNHPPGLVISGSLLTDTLNYANITDTGNNVINVEAGGLFNVRNSITKPSDTLETIAIAGGGAGGHLELGSASSSGIDVNNGDVSFGFDNNSDTSVKNAGEIEFNGSSFAAGSVADQHIFNVAWGDSFVFDGADFDGDTFSYSGITLTVKHGSTTILTMGNVGGSGLTAANFIASGDTIELVCFAAGTRILTATGERPVECLLQGDIVLTLAGGELHVQPVKWLGRRRLDLTAHPHPETVAPVRIRRGAFADAMPHTDLLVSPDHAIFVDGRLICARQLINGTTIHPEKGWSGVEYFHVELDTHAILLAEGLPTESYLNTGNRGFFANSGEPLVLHPDLTDGTDYPTREAGSCAPFVWDEASVRPVWQRLSERAAALGQPVRAAETTQDPALHLVAAGRRIKPIYADAGLFIFPLPRRNVGAVRLVSRAGAPTDARPWLDDRRRLGVQVARIVLRDATEVREIPMDHPDLNQGWWAVERDGTAARRWTDGEAALPLPAMHGATMLEIHLRGALDYVVSGDESRQAA